MDTTPTPEDAERQASELLDRRRTAQARALLGEALQRDPAHPGLLLQLARAHYLEDRHGDAREVVERLLASEPDHYGGRVLLFELLMADDEKAEAEQVVLGLLKSYPRTPDLYARYARLMLRALQFTKARALVVEALRLDPHDEAALGAQVLCDLVELPKGTDSRALSQLLAANPDDLYTLSLVVTALAQEGRNRAALRVAQGLLRAQPGNPHWLAVVRDLRMQTHWSMLPLWPLQLWGWTASIALWIGTVLLLNMLARSAPGLVSVLNPLLLGYVIYSWVWPPLLQRWLARD